MGFFSCFQHTVTTVTMGHHSTVQRCSRHATPGKWPSLENPGPTQTCNATTLLRWNHKRMSGWHFESVPQSKILMWKECKWWACRAVEASTHAVRRREVQKYWPTNWLDWKSQIKLESEHLIQKCPVWNVKISHVFVLWNGDVPSILWNSSNVIIFATKKIWNWRMKTTHHHAQVVHSHEIENPPCSASLRANNRRDFKRQADSIMKKKKIFRTLLA